jgi:Resolvase, N terminal domain
MPTMTTKRAVIYVRVSTVNRTSKGDGFEQNPEVQELPLRQMIAQRGWILVRIYSDRMSGAKENRPGLNGLMQAARRGEFDVVAWKHRQRLRDRPKDGKTYVSEQSILKRRNADASRPRREGRYAGRRQLWNRHSRCVPDRQKRPPERGYLRRPTIPVRP